MRRWEAAEGRELGEIIGWALNEGELVTNFADRLFEQAGPFYEAEYVEALERE